jgi:beta-1,4-mannosyl-glycoprotein beta-1,4-N-acetylglucosaminyltransferase
MYKSKIIDCITFFDNNFMFEIRYNILKNYVDYFVVCESRFNHKGIEKNKNFIWKKEYDKKKIKYFFLQEPFPKNNSPWKNQAIQREFLLECTDFADQEDYIFFSDPDEIINPNLLINFKLRKKYGIFFQDCFNYKFNLFNPHETPWEGTRVAKKKNLTSIDFMRQKVKSKNLKYNFFRFDKEKNIEVYEKAGWHFNNLMSAEDISLKLKTFAHSEFSNSRFSNISIIENKIINKIDLFERGHKYIRVNLDDSFPKYIINNKNLYRDWIL